MRLSASMTSLSQPDRTGRVNAYSIDPSAAGSANVSGSASSGGIWILITFRYFCFASASDRPHQVTS